MTPHPNLNSGTGIEKMEDNFKQHKVFNGKSSSGLERNVCSENVKKIDVARA